MFVAADARARLQAEGRESFFAEVVDPVAERALALGVPLEDVIARLRTLAAERDGGAA
jgi:DNA-binding transcriptional regulator YhcF (GntR family)